MKFIFGIFPLLAVPVIIYNLMAAGFTPTPDGVATMGAHIGNPVMSIGMVAANTKWDISSGDILIFLSLVFFFIEILKSTSTGAASIANHAVSMLLFIVCLVEFLLFPNFATSIFFVLTMMCLLDVLAGVVVTIISARRDFTVGDGGH